MAATIAIDARIINSTTGRYVERLVYYLEQLDTTNRYILLVPTKDLQYYKPRNPNFSVMAADFDNYSLSEQLGFLHFLLKLKPDLVHFCMPQQPVLYRGKHVTTFHDLILLNTYNSDKNFLLFKIKQLIGRFVFKSVAKRSDRIIVPTQYVKGELIAFSHISPRKIVITNEGCEVATTDTKTYEPLKNKKFLLYVGQQSDYKNIRRLMLATQTLRKKHQDLLLVLVGSMRGKNGPPLVANKQWAAKQGYQGIIYTDFLKDAHLRWCMANCQAYVFPSLMEGFGLPALEAVAAGAPLVCSNATCLPEVHGDAAEYFDPLSVDGMAAAIDRVLTNPARRKELIKKGAERVKRYSWKRMAEQTLALYNDVLLSETHKTD